MPADFDAAWSWITDRVLLALSSENAGGADAILRKTVDYANQRIQFGKPIASYQAIKHKCADMMMKVESSKALTYYCAWALSEGADVGPLAASMAKSFTSDAYRFCTSGSDSDPRRDRFHVGNAGAPVFQAGARKRGDVRQPGCASRASHRTRHRGVSAATRRPRPLDGIRVLDFTDDGLRTVLHPSARRRRRDGRQARSTTAAI